MTDFVYADAGPILKRSLLAFNPPERLDVADYATAHRTLRNEGGGYIGPWRFADVPYIEGPHRCLTMLEHQTVAVVGPGQSAKALALDTPIPTLTGWSTMGALQPGDIIFDENGQQCRVVVKSPVHHGNECFRVNFSDGASITADAGHLWAVETHSRPRRPDGTRFNVWDVPKVLTTAHIARTAKGGGTDNRYAVRVAGALQTEVAELPVRPYALGVWLGDGHSHGDRLTLHEQDGDILFELLHEGYGIQRMGRTSTGVLTIRIRTDARVEGECPRGHDVGVMGRYDCGKCRACARQDYGRLREGLPRLADARDSLHIRLRALGVTGDKHIPPAYMRASPAQRLALLQGLMDTDGTIGTTGTRASFTSTSPRLAQDVLELVRSLGLKPTMKRREAYAVVKGVRRPGADAYKIDFTAYAELPVFRLGRKQARQLPATGRRTTETRRRRIVSVEPVESVPTQCIQVDSPSRLYLAGEAMIPTHNTTCAENWLLRMPSADPGNLLWYMQNNDAIEAYVKDRINPMIEAHELQLKQYIGSRKTDDSLSYKGFRTMSAQFLSATKRNLISKSAPRIVLDEIDAFAEMGDVMAQIDVRRQTFGEESKVLAVSHPDLATGLDPEKDWTRGIMSIYGDSDRRLWYWDCPRCGGTSSPNPLGTRVMTLKYPEDAPLDEIEEAAHLLCPICQGVVQDRERRAMNSTGRWVGLGQEISQDGVISGQLVPKRTAGFWIVGLMSPFLLGGIGKLAREKVKAQRALEINGDQESLRQVTVKQEGVPYAPPRRVGSIEADELAGRAEPDLRLGVVPAGVRFMTAFLDCQITYWDVMIRGWGARGESWIVDTFKIPGDPATSADDWDQIIGAVLKKVYPLEGVPGRGMGVIGTGYDSGGQPGVSQQAADAFTRWRRAGLVKKFGKGPHGDVYSVMPTKGMSNVNAQRLSIVYPDTKANPGKKGVFDGSVPVGNFNPNSYKDDLAGQLGKQQPGPWFVHFPAQLRDKNPKGPHRWFEQLVAENRNAAGKWEPRQAHIRNEATDLMVGNHVIASAFGVARMNWEKPPGWAAEWGKNSAIVDYEPDPAEAPRSPSGKVFATPAKKTSYIDRFA